MPDLRRVLLALALLAAFLAAGQAGLADGEEDGGGPAAADGGAPATDAAETAETKTLHKVYVPFRDLSKVFEKEDEGVFLPYAEFLDLWRRAQGLTADGKETEIRAAVRAAAYEGEATGDLVELEATLEVDVLAAGWQRIPLDFSGAGIERAQVDGEPALIVPAAGGTGYELLLEDAGRRTLTLSLRIGTTREGDRRTAAFSLPPVPLSRLALDLPGSATQVEVTPRLASTTEATDDGRTRLLAFLGPVDRIQIGWQQRVEEGPRVEPLVFADEQHDVRVDPGVVRSELVANLSILRAPLERLVVPVPAGAVTLYVQGDGIRTWTRSEDGTRIDIALREPIRDHWQVRLGLEQPLPPLPATVTLPLAAVDGVERETGFVRVLAGEGVKVEPASTEGLLQIDLAELPDPLRAAPSGRAFGYRYPARPGAVTVGVDALEPRISAEVGTRVVLRPEGTEVRYAAVLTVERAGIFGLQVTVPEGLEITAVRVHGVEYDDHKIQVDDQGARILSVEFRDRLLGGARLDVEGRRSTPLPGEEAGSEEETSFAVPLPRLLGAEHVRGYVAVHVDAAIEHRETAREGLVPLDASAPAALEPPAVPGPAVAVAYRLEHHEAPTALTLGLKRRAPAVTARVETWLRLEPDRTRLGTTIRYDVRYRGVDTLRFTAPLGVGRRMHLDLEGVQLLGPEALEDEEGGADRGLWTVKLPSPRLGDIPIPLEFEDVPEDPLVSGASRRVALPQVVPLADDRTPLPNTVHEVAVRRDPLLEVATVDLDRAEEIDARELPATLASDENFLAFRAYDPAWSGSLLVTRHDYEPVAEIVISHLHLDTAIGREGRATTEAYFVVRNNDRQNLVLGLPAGATIRAVTVDGKTKQPRQGENGSVLIPLPSGLGKDEAFVVAIAYDHDVDRSDTLFFETIGLETPRVEQDVVADLLTWRVFAPEDRVYTSFGGTVEPARPEHSWFATLVEDVFRTFGRRAQASDVDIRRVVSGFETPFATRHEGVSFLFSNRVGTGHLSISSSDPEAFAFWKLLWFVVFLALGVLLGGLAGRSGLGEARFFAAAILVVLVLLVRAEPGTAQVLNAMLYGLVVAAVLRLVLASVRARRARRAETPSDEPEPVPPAHPGTEGGAA